MRRLRYCVAHPLTGRYKACVVRIDARHWIIQEQVGLLSKMQIVELADNYILNHEISPDWMFKLSLGESLAREPLLDLIIEPINDRDCSYIASIVLRNYKNSELGMKEIGLIAKQLASLIDENCECLHNLYWITDESDLVSLGYKPSSGFKQNIEGVLAEIIAL